MKESTYELDLDLPDNFLIEDGICGLITIEVIDDD